MGAALALPGFEEVVDDLVVDGVVVRLGPTRGDFRVLDVEVERDGRGVVETWIGEVPPVAVSQRVRGSGTWETHREYGKRFRLSMLVGLVPTTRKAIIDYLSAGIIPGIGPALSERIVEHFGDGVLDVLDLSPDRISEVPGIGPDRAEKVAKGWRLAQATARMTIFLQSHGATPGLASKIVQHYLGRNEDPMTVVTSTPYRLALEVYSVGFHTADIIARSIGIGADSDTRAQAAALHLLDDIGKNGHVYVDLDDLTTKVATLTARAGGEARASIRRAIEELGATDGKIVVEPYDGEPEETLFGREVQRRAAVFPAEVYAAEWDVARRLVTLAGSLGRGRVDAVETMREHAEAAIAAAPITLAEEQRTAVLAAAEHAVIVVTGGPGTGKCLGRGTPVLMFDGTVKPVEAVHNGDLLMGPDSRARRVSATTTGIGPLYEIQPIKGDPWVCNNVHMLTLVRSGTGQVRDIPLCDWLGMSRGMKWKARGKLFRVGVDFQAQETPIDPYVMGAWLGNGTRANTIIHTPWRELVDALEVAAKAAACRASIRWQKRDNCWAVSLIRKRRSKRAARNPFRDAFRAALDNGTKFIPRQYLINSREMRLRLLAGLIDTDGHATSGCLEIISKWKRLADDIAFLARSLGMAAYISEKMVQLKGWASARMYFRVMISGRLDEIPTLVPNRKIAPRKQIKETLRTGFKAKPLGEGDYFGFELDGDGRFLLGDFTVTHNTTILQVILDLYRRAGMRVACCAPTARAANRMTEATGTASKTIHRLLEIQRGNRPFYTEDRPLDTDVLVVDESSMVDLRLAAHLLGAVPDGARVVIIGDRNQLPSVQPGAVLHDIITSGVVPVVELNRIYRQGPGSTISKAAAAINRGEIPSGDAGSHGEFFRISRGSQEEAAATIEHLVTTRIPSVFGIPTSQIAVLVPQHKGAGGTFALNDRLQEALNPHGTELARSGKRFRVGDPIVQRKNDYTREVFNGDRGVVSAVDMAAAEVVVNFDGRSVRCDDEGMGQITLGYATTIHSSQGGEFPAVVIYAGSESEHMLACSMLYTAVTRGKKLVVVVATTAVIASAIRRKDRRRTRLAARLKSLSA